MPLSQFLASLWNRSPYFSWPGHWITGEWKSGRHSGTQKSSYNPNSGERLIDVWVEREIHSLAIERSLALRNTVAQIPLEKRMEALKRLRVTISDFQKEWERVLEVEAGKPHWEAERDIESAIKYIDWISENSQFIMKSLLSPAQLGHIGGHFEMLPLGVTAAYLPFSTPLTTFALYISASLLAGCPLIISTSSHAMVSGLFLAILCEKAEIPVGCLSIIFGNFQGFRQFVADKRVAAILYTGSREHCDFIRTESRSLIGRQIILQSGGKNSVIIDASADLNLAVKCVLFGALTSAGQRCTSTSRVFVHKTRSQEFRDALHAAFCNISIGRTDELNQDTNQKNPFMGPLYSEKAVEKYLRFQTMAARESEKTILWGKVLDTENRGYFVTPSIHYLKRFDNSSAYQGNVLFAPDVAIYDFDDLETAATQINTTDAAFAVSFMGDPEIIKKNRRFFLAPNLLIHVPTIEIEASLPLAGRLQSGHHRFHGPGIALYLCYPQVLSHDTAMSEAVASWPWPTTTSS